MKKTLLGITPVVAPETRATLIGGMEPKLGSAPAPTRRVTPNGRYRISARDRGTCPHCKRALTECLALPCRRIQAKAIELLVELEVDLARSDQSAKEKELSAAKRRISALEDELTSLMGEK